MNISELGEAGLIDRIIKQTQGRVKKSKSVLKGIGDDTAVIGHSDSKLLLATTDTLVERVHFDRSFLEADKIGHKAMVANISDIVAMGGVSKYALVSLAIPVSNCVELVDNLYRGMEKTAKEYGVLIVGGDTVKSPRDLTITLTLLGEVSKKQLITRSGAKIGDKLLVTGTFGDSALGLEILKRGNTRISRAARFLANRHREPSPRGREARLLAKKGLATSMIDSSDGLDESIRLICGQSGVGARVWLESIPMSDELKTYVKGKFRSGSRFPEMKYALYGGEDYELVFTVPEKKLKLTLRTVPGVKLIGEILPRRSGISYSSNGKKITIKGKGFRHFGKKA